jgi:autotransporter passenger strand-loop-strand repeat protein
VLVGPGELLSNGAFYGLVSGASLSSGVFFLFGSASDVTLLRSSLLWDFGTAAGTIVTDGAELDTGLAVDSEVESGGKELIDSGEVGSGDTIQSGGLLQVLSGGTAIDETVQSGGTFDLGGDLASDLTLGAAMSGAVLDGVTVSSGGFIELGSATVLSGVTLSLGGTTVDADDVDVDAGGAAWAGRRFRRHRSGIGQRHNGRRRWRDRPCVRRERQ